MVWKKQDEEAWQEMNRVCCLAIGMQIYYFILQTDDKPPDDCYFLLEQLLSDEKNVK